MAVLVVPEGGPIAINLAGTAPGSAERARVTFDGL
jgi:hypothetical protein